MDHWEGFPEAGGRYGGVFRCAKSDLVAGDVRVAHMLARELGTTMGDSPGGEEVLRAPFRAARPVSSAEEARPQRGHHGGEGPKLVQNHPILPETP